MELHVCSCSIVTVPGGLCARESEWGDGTFWNSMLQTSFFFLFFTFHFFLIMTRWGLNKLIIQIRPVEKRNVKDDGFLVFRLPIDLKEPISWIELC